MSTVRVVDVALDPRNGGSEAVWTYRDEPGLEIGDGVFVPLGTRATLGFVVARYEATEAELGFPLDALRGIVGKVEGISLPAQVVEVARGVATDTLCSLPVALSVATPPGVRDRLVTAWRATSEEARGEPPAKLTAMQSEVLRVLRESEGLVESKSKKLPPATARALKALRTKGLVEQTLRLAPFQERRKGDTLIRLGADAKAVEAFLKREGRRKPAQALTLMRMQAAESGALTLPEIKALAGVTESTVKALLDAGFLDRIDEDAPRVRQAPTPNPAQQLAIDAAVEAVQGREARPFLLYGVTGSGKTEVYLRTAAEALRAGRQVLYVVPEIALAAQAIALLRERFGRSVAVLHSDLSPTERLQNWLRIRNGEASVVLGARSALFAPLSNVGLVVVDEEHEAAYKQESAPRYHAKQVALALGRLHCCPVILGSATPSVESFFEAEERDERELVRTIPLTLLSLPERTASARLPLVEIRDLTVGYRIGQPSILTQDLHDRLRVTLDRGEQAILFLNRRAYAPFIICRDCGNQMQCPHCSVSLSYHRNDRRLRCHHCGFHMAPPDKCPKCQGIRLSPFGVGTEKVEEAVAAEYPDARVARLDRDVARRKGALEETLAAFRSGDIHILVGTQIVAKGLDFPNVTLVGVIAADISLNIPDFRSSERTFQLLSQVAGRAGRGQAPGLVLIQTFNPNHPAVVAAREHDFLAIYDTLRRERMEAGYPPFKRLVNVTLTGENRASVIRASQEAAELLRREILKLGAQVLGPVDCAVERLQGKWRRHMLIKLPPASSPVPIGEILLGFERKGVQIVVDVDPYTLM